MAAIDAEPSRELFVHDHRARLKAEPGAFTAFLGVCGAVALPQL